MLTFAEMAKSIHALRYRQLPEFLRQMREAAGLTQRDLAKKLQIVHTLIHNSETGQRRVDVSEFGDWAKACGVDPVDAFRDFMRKR